MKHVEKRTTLILFVIFTCFDKIIQILLLLRELDVLGPLGEYILDPAPVENKVVLQSFKRGSFHWLLFLLDLRFLGFWSAHEFVAKWLLVLFFQ